MGEAYGALNFSEMLDGKNEANCALFGQARPNCEKTQDSRNGEKVVP